MSLLFMMQQMTEFVVIMEKGTMPYQSEMILKQLVVILI